MIYDILSLQWPRNCLMADEHFWYKWISYRAYFISTDPSIHRFIANSLATLHICNYCTDTKNRAQNNQHLKLAGTKREVPEYLFRFLSGQKCPVCYARYARPQRPKAIESWSNMAPWPASLAGRKCDLCYD